MGQTLEFGTRADHVQQKRTLDIHGFIAEFFTNSEVDPPVYHYVVMRRGSVEILGWGQENTPGSAERMARNCIEMLSQRTKQAI